MTDETLASPKRSRRAADGAVPATGDPGIAGADPESRAEAFARAEAEAADAALRLDPVPAVTPAGPIDHVAVSSLRLERGGINEATADTVEVRMGGIGALGAEEVFVQWGGVGAARADRLGVEFGGVGAALTGELQVTQGFAGTVVAREATIEQGIARTLIAQRVTIKRPSAVLVLIAARVEGDVRPLLDWRGALAAGLVFGLVSVVGKVLRDRR